MEPAATEVRREPGKEVLRGTQDRVSLTSMPFLGLSARN